MTVGIEASWAPNKTGPMLEKSENFSSQSSENGFGIVRHRRIEFDLRTLEIFPFFKMAA